MRLIGLFGGKIVFFAYHYGFSVKSKLWEKCDVKSISTLFSVKLEKFLTKSISQKNSQWNGVKVYFGVEKKKDVEVFFSQFPKIQSISNWILLDLLLSNFINYSKQHRQKYFINWWIFFIDFFLLSSLFFLAYDIFSSKSSICR